MKSNRAGKAAAATRRSPLGRKARPASQFKLTCEEIAMLPDRNWVTEDDADAIIARRRSREEHVPLEQVVKQLGYRMEDFIAPKRAR